MARLSLAEPLVAGGGEGGKEAAGWGAAKAHVAEAKEAPPSTTRPTTRARRVRGHVLVGGLQGGAPL